MVSASLVAACAGSIATAQPIVKDAYSRRRETPIVIPHLETLRVTPHGVAAGPYSGPTGRGCNILASHTDANFSGGQFVLQQGMVDGEAFAATYTIAAGEFPIKINLVEVIVAQSNATVATTTQWSVLFYEGTPQAGTLVETFSSDDLILPHVRMQPGTQGTNVQFSVEPSDPEQIILQDNGSHSFTVAFRIDRLNAPPANPCQQAPNPNQNAFLCTDASGLSQPTNNWLLGINCGQFGCPANGGWARFSQLLSFCRPTGDWVGRTTWSSVPNCTPGLGACCLPSGQCLTGQTPSGCTGQGGTYRGDGSTCASPCPQPSGACCFPNGFCTSLSSTDCTGAGGAWAGASTVCGANNTCPTGACCLPSGQCQTNVTSAQCAGQGGTFRGVGTDCSQACPQPSGACCFSSGTCIVMSEANCTGTGTGTWAGPFTTCPGACSAACYPNCDTSTGQPRLTANDFQCFLDKFAAGATYANCDGSTGQPNLTANDFQCFLNKFAAGCT